MSWWQSMILGGAAMAIQAALATVKNEASRRKMRSTLLMIWQAARQIPMAYPGDPDFQ